MPAQALEGEPALWAVVGDEAVEEPARNVQVVVLLEAQVAERRAQDPPPWKMK